MIYCALTPKVNDLVYDPTSDLSTVEEKTLATAAAALTTDGGNPLAAFIACCVQGQYMEVQAQWMG